jgi:sugar lactone lactonase YvrE
VTAAAPITDIACDLGEGPLWHPEAGCLFWFDITGRRLLRLDGETTEVHDFPEMVSAAGWVDRDRLLVASEAGLMLYHWRDRRIADRLADLDADRPATRSNDGRADPQGGFWIGTMGKAAEPGAGAIWRWHRGVLRRLWAGITIPNAICFRPDGRTAHFADTVTHRVMRVALDAEGWPAGAPEVFLDLAAEGRNPDGAVVDAEGVLWLAEWGAGRVAAYGPDGRFLRSVTVPAPHSSCPAFGGADLADLYCTTARQGLDAAALDAAPQSGLTFRAPGIGRGQAEHRVILP